MVSTNDDGGRVQGEFSVLPADAIHQSSGDSSTADDLPPRSAIRRALPQLAHLVAQEPPPDLVSATLRRIASIGGRAPGRPLPPRRESISAGLIYLGT